MKFLTFLNDCTSVEDPSGLLSAQKLLEGIEGIGFAQLTALDVVRHPLVQKIIERYEAAEHAPRDEKNTEI